MSAPNSLRSRRPAFTLIELLTVIAIIGILAAIIIPTVGKVRQSANNAACKSTLRQIGMATMLWSNDNKDFLLGWKAIPPGSTASAAWMQSALPYMSRQGNTMQGSETLLKTCKSFESDPNYDPAFASDNNRIGYGMNRWPAVNEEGSSKQFTDNWNDGTQKPTIRRNDIQNVRNAVYLSDCNTWCYGIYIPSDKGQVGRRHSEQANAFFIDGSVRSLTVTEFTRLVWRE